MKIFFDTEFIEDGKTIDLISIGMVREDGETYYASSPERNPQGPSSEYGRVLRGGSCWDSFDDDLRADYRNGISPNLRNYNRGFRIALS